MLDEETKKELTDAESILFMTESRGWKVVKERLDAKIVDLQLIGNVEGSTPDEKVKNMEARAMAVTILYDWLRDDVYGYIEQQKAASEALQDTNEEGFVSRSTL